jgi:hypothetical protein
MSPGIVERSQLKRRLRLFSDIGFFVISNRTSAILPVLALSLALTPTASAQAANQLPRFEDYRVTNVFTGTPAFPVLVTADQKRFRTQIQEGVTKGIGVMRDGKEQAGANFAGHYIVVEWSCGSPCGMLAIVDAATGKVYAPPISDGFLLPPMPATDPDNPNRFIPWVAEVDFRLGSELMIISANPNLSKSRVNYAHYFLWESNQWKLLRRIPMEPVGR